MSRRQEAPKMVYALIVMMIIGFFIGMVCKTLSTRGEKMSWMSTGADYAYDRGYYGIKEVWARIRATRLDDNVDLNLVHFVTLDDKRKVNTYALLAGARWLYTAKDLESVINDLKRDKPYAQTSFQTVECWYTTKASYLQGVPDCDSWNFLVGLRIEGVTLCLFVQPDPQLTNRYMLIWITPEHHLRAVGSHLDLMEVHHEAAVAALHGHIPGSVRWEALRTPVDS